MITIINGGTQGLGDAVARKLAGAGATGLVLAGRSTELGSTLARELTDLGTPSIFVAADITDVDAPQAIVGACAVALRHRARPRQRRRARRQERRCSTTRPSTSTG